MTILDARITDKKGYARMRMLVRGLAISDRLLKWDKSVWALSRFIFMRQGKAKKALSYFLFMEVSL